MQEELRLVVEEGIENFYVYFLFNLDHSQCTHRVCTSVCSYACVKPQHTLPVNWNPFLS